MYANAHIDPAKTDPFEPSDFMPTGNRQKRLAGVWMERAKLVMNPVGADPTEGLPEWAIGPYKGVN